MEVLIVGKTKMTTGCCIGALNMGNNQSLRLLESNGSNPPRSTPYKVGQIWEISCSRVTNPRPPHTEDVLVRNKRLIRTIVNVGDEIIARTQVHRGSINGLYQGLINFTHAGSGYISEVSGVPNYSTCFWITDRRLIAEFEGNRIRYRYDGLPRGSLVYVGFEEPLNVIPARTLVRVSSARWWTPPDSYDEERCYTQLSGWYL